MRNVCIFSRIVHNESGRELDPGFLQEGTYVESIELDGPKLMLTYSDPYRDISKNMRIQEGDEFSVSFGDAWFGGAVFEQDNFTVISAAPQSDYSVRLELMASNVYEMKKLVEKPQSFIGQGISEIIGAFSGGMSSVLSVFPIISSYISAPGERPSETMRRLAAEQGAELWYARGEMHMRRFAEMYAQSPALRFEHGRLNCENAILQYSKISQQMQAQEKSIRTFTGWDELLGRLTSPLDGLLSKATSKANVITGLANASVLGNATVGRQTVIDFAAVGNMQAQAGQAIKLVWNTNDPANPLNEGLPDKVVIESVAHHYSSQRYYCRIQGAIAVEPV